MWIKLLRLERKICQDKFIIIIHSPDQSQEIKNQFVNVYHCMLCSLSCIVDCILYFVYMLMGQLAYCLIKYHTLVTSAQQTINHNSFFNQIQDRNKFHFNEFGMSRPGIEPVTPRSPEQKFYRLIYRGRLLRNEIGSSTKCCHSHLADGSQND